MKIVASFLLCVLGLLACEQSTKTTPASESETVLQAFPTVSSGAVLLADSMPIPDPLNHFYFAVALVANEYSQQGTYDVQAHYGPAKALTQITFPQGGTKKIIPKLKKGREPFTYQIGFQYGADDTSFYAYYEVKGSKEKIEMNYLKAYSFK